MHSEVIKFPTIVAPSSNINIHFLK